MTSLISQHRHFFVISGQYQWTILKAEQLLKKHSRQIWITNQHIPSVQRIIIPVSKVASLLGQEENILVYDTFSGFNIDAFGLVSGVIRGGGILILLTPEFNRWINSDDPENRRLFALSSLGRKSYFIQRTVNLIQQASEVVVITDNAAIPTEQEMPVVTKGAEQNNQQQGDGLFGAVTAEQEQAIKAITTLCHAQKPGVFVLTSDRGRGKSSALGLAAAWIINQAQSFAHIIVTAPQPATVKSLFSCANRLLVDGLCNNADTQIQHASGTIRFIAPDLLTASLPETDILLVDEAAAIPAPLMQKWLTYYKKIVFSTTIHGYEGTGRGFAVRFQKILQASYPGYKHLHMHTPIRWAKDDPAERLIFDLLGLNSIPASDQQALVAYKQQGYRYVICTQKMLLAQHDLLSQIFGLLVISHYQTRPADFRRLLDAPDIEIHTLISSHNERTIVLGVALTFSEEPVDSGLQQDVYFGKRRLRGKMLPQLLATQCNTIDALSARCVRIQRIAVHPALQSIGLGSMLVTNIISQMQTANYDYVGSNFGATAALLSFWKKNGFSFIGISSRCDASSACHASTVVYPLSETGKQIVQQAQSHFLNQLPHLLKEPLKNLELPVCITLFTHLYTVSLPVIFSEAEIKSIEAYIHGYRLYDYVVCTLHKALLHAIVHAKFSLLNKEQQSLLVMKIAQGHTWKVCVEKLGLSGKKAADKNLREAYTIIYGFLK